MLGRKLITFLVGSNIRFGRNLANVRAVHFLPVTTQNFNFEDRVYADSHCRSLLSHRTNASLFDTVKRYKTKKKKTKDEESDSDEDDEDLLDNVPGPKDAKVLTQNVISMRIDAITKITFGLARNKVEAALYGSDVRLNGQKILKKSQLVNVGDTIDIIRGPSPKNENHKIVSRVIILSAVNVDTGYRVKFTRDKSLVTDEYDS